VATIVGPNIQLPAGRVTDEQGQASIAHMTFLNGVQQISWIVTRSGVTAVRPTSTVKGRWIGLPFYDTTLQKHVFLSSVNPDVWKDASGNVV